MDIGGRVGAILSATPDTIYLIGYGTYQGNQQHPEYGFPNPKLVMDDGTVAWGMECWWGAEDEMKKEYAQHKVIEVVKKDGQWHEKEAA